MAISWHIEQRNLKDLIPHPHNPRTLSKHDATHLKQSIAKFGLIDLPIINLDNTIIGGHQRIAILKKTRTKSCDCWIPNRLLEQSEVNELNIRLNRNTGNWDYDELANNWDVQELQEWGFTSLDFEQFELEELEQDQEHSGINGDTKTKLCPNCGEVL